MSNDSVYGAINAVESAINTLSDVKSGAMGPTIAEAEAALLRGIKEAADAIRRWEEAEKLRQAVTVEMLRELATSTPIDEHEAQGTLAKSHCTELLAGMNVLTLSTGDRLYILTDFGAMLADAISDDDTWRAAIEAYRLARQGGDGVRRGVLVCIGVVGDAAMGTQHAGGWEMSEDVGPWIEKGCAIQRRYMHGRLAASVNRIRDENEMIATVYVSEPNRPRCSCNVLAEQRSADRDELMRWCDNLLRWGGCKLDVPGGLPEATHGTRRKGEKHE